MQPRKSARMEIQLCQANGWMRTNLATIAGSSLLSAKV